MFKTISELQSCLVDRLNKIQTTEIEVIYYQKGVTFVKETIQLEKVVESAYYVDWLAQSRN